MEDGTRLKLIVLGLVLAAIAGAYLFFSGRFASRNQVAQNPQPTTAPSAIPLEMVPPIVVPPNQQPPLISDTPPAPLPGTGISGDVANLPNTGLPMELIGSLGAASVVIGYALRRFPK